MADDSDTGMQTHAERDDWSGEVTEPLRFGISVESSSQTRCNGLFERLADVLEFNEAAVERLLSELLVYVDAAPATLTPAQLWEMRTGLFEIVDSVLPVATRERRRSRLEVLMLEVAPLQAVG